LRDITSYMTTAAFLLLNHAAENRAQWLRRFYEIGKEAVRPNKKGDIVAFKVRLTPARPAQAKGADALLGIMAKAGVEYEIGVDPGVEVPSKIALIKTAQPYGGFVRALLQPQLYPDLRDSAGHPIAPYDVTAHSLPLLMGAEVTPVYHVPRLVNLRSYSASTTDEIAKVRIGLYRPLPPSMDEGWTRWVMEQEGRTFTSLLPMAVRNGNLDSTFDVIVIPDQSARTLLNGYAKGVMPSDLNGGLGTEGVNALKVFVEAGGTLICLNRASEFAIEQFKLPIRNVVAGLPRTEFYVPGSILRMQLDTSHPIAKGMPRQSIAWAEESPVFEVMEAAASSSATTVRTIGWYPRDKEPLLSGWLLGGSRIKGKAALVEVRMGKGRVVLFGFRPQYRAQSLATYPLFFNALNYTGVPLVPSSNK
jgi:hypothetical protein